MFWHKSTQDYTKFFNVYLQSALIKSNSLGSQTQQYESTSKILVQNCRSLKFPIDTFLLMPSIIRQFLDAHNYLTVVWIPAGIIRVFALFSIRAIIYQINFIAKYNLAMQHILKQVFST